LKIIFTEDEEEREEKSWKRDVKTLIGLEID
jgi:hypothetical protein